MVKLHMDGKVIYTQRSSQCGFGGLARPKLLGTKREKPDERQGGEVTSCRG